MILLFAIVLWIIIGSLGVVAVYKQVTGYVAIRRALRDLVSKQDSLAAAVEELSTVENQAKESAAGDESRANRGLGSTALDENRVCFYLSCKSEPSDLDLYRSLLLALVRSELTRSSWPLELSSLKWYSIADEGSEPTGVFVIAERHARPSKELERSWERQDVYGSFGVAAACGL